MNIYHHLHHNHQYNLVRFIGHFQIGQKPLSNIGFLPTLVPEVNEALV